MESYLNKIKAKIRGSISLLAMTALVTSSLAGVYYYIDNKADTQAQHTLSQLLEDAKDEGVQLSYNSVDASPLLRSVSISGFKIKGNADEPDITLGNVNITGFNWQNLDQDTSQLPLSMSITVDNALLHLKPSMVKNDANIQALIDNFGEQVAFSTHLSYALDQDSGILKISTTDTVIDNFYFNSELTLGGANWLAELDTQSKEDPFSEVMSTTLNTFSIIFKNEGIIEKIRAIAAKQTGQTQEQLTRQSVNDIKRLQIVAEKNWGPLFVPMIDELIKFTIKPEQLTIRINPEQAITSDAFMLGLLGGDAALLELIKQAQIEIKAN